MSVTSKDLPMILSVDDCRTNLKLTEKMLSGLAVRVVKANSGKEALSLVLRHHFALVLMDIHMPGLDGLETASVMRNYMGSREVPIIFITAPMVGESHVKRGYSVGGVDYLLKPVDPNILRSKVRVFLEMDAKARKLKETMASLHFASQRNRMLLDCAGEGIIGFDLNGKIVFANPMASSLLGYANHKLEGSHIFQFLKPPGQEHRLGDWELSSIYAACCCERSFKQENETFYRANGLGFPVGYTVTSANLEDMGYAGGVIVFRDITERKRVEAQLLRLARYDQLTELANRTFFHEFLTATIARAKRREKKFAVVVVDLNGFKQVNDQLGHASGDVLLRTVADRLKECVREGDLVSRLGGDEFSIIFDDLYALEDSMHLCQQVLEKFTQPFELDDREVYVGASLGVATFPDMFETAEELIKAADAAMYQAKRAGQNQVRFYEPVFHEQAMERTRVTVELRKAAVFLKDFQVYFQPKVDAYGERIVGLEALVRWFHPELGLVNPAQFIPLAEKTGDIAAIGDWVLERSCESLQKLIAQSLVAPDLKVAVNVSLRQLKAGHFLRNLKRVLEATNLNPQNLEIEITESIFMEDTSYAVHILKEIHELGITIAVDDFGTGYSSLNYLSRLPIDILKIDRSFVRDIGKDACEDTIVRAIISLAHSLHLKVVAEGVETHSQIAFLNANTCDMFQGFYYYKPMGLPALTEVLTHLKHQAGCIDVRAC